MRYSNIKSRVKVLRNLSQVISYLLHPLLMPTLIFAAIFYFCPIVVNIGPQVRDKLLWMIFIITFGFPFISIFFLMSAIKKSFSITDLEMEDRRERFYPFLFTGFFYCAITYLLVQSGLDPNIIAIMGGISLSIVIVAIISYYWKISAHAVGICGALGYLLVVSNYYPSELMVYPVAVVTVLAGLLLSARLNLNVHTPAQIFGGAALGLAVSILSFILFQNYGLAIIY